MLLFLALGVVAGVAHHIFYAFLHNRHADGGVFTSLRSILRTTVTDQSLVNLFGNTISRVASVSEISFGRPQERRIGGLLRKN